MISPLDRRVVSQPRRFLALTHLTYWIAGPGGGGVSRLGSATAGRSQTALGAGARVVPRLRLRRQSATQQAPDQRTGQSISLLPRAPTRVARPWRQCTKRGASVRPLAVWTPLDMGQVELGYDGGVVGLRHERLSVQAPAELGRPVHHACAQWADPTRLPHNFELFGLWNVACASASARNASGPRTEHAAHGLRLPITCRRA